LEPVGTFGCTAAVETQKQLKLILERCKEWESSERPKKVTQLSSQLGGEVSDLLKIPSQVSRTLPEPRLLTWRVSWNAC
jgi:hypothetical protein